MFEKWSASPVLWGAWINTSPCHDAGGCPTWARPADRDMWIHRILVIWKAGTKHAIGMSASQALRILDELCSDDAWAEQGITIVEPGSRIPGEGPEKSDLYLRPAIHLSPRQTKGLLGLLERNEAWLRKMSEEEKEEVSRVLARVYRYLFRLVDEEERARAAADGVPND